MPTAQKGHDERTSMLDILSKGIRKLFGDKSERDIKDLEPKVAEINKIYEELKSLSHNDLRAKSQELREHVRQAVSEFTEKIEALRAEAKTVNENPGRQEELFDEVDELVKQKDKRYEEVLEEILPQAFAVMKDTARRFTENSEIRVNANDRDRNLAAKNDFVSIEGDEAIYYKKWSAAGNEIEWNMIHYDVQLIGGIVLHSGKIAEMATGEGKTLVATLPAYLNGLTGESVHIVTVNDYLARRDAEWNRPVFEFLGITVDCIEYHQPHSPW